MGGITCKFGGSSLADAACIRQAQTIIDANPERRFIVPSAPGKRSPEDRKITDLLYAWHSIAAQGLDASEPRRIIADRFSELARELGVKFEILPLLDEINEQAGQGTADYMASRGEYLNGHLMAEVLDATFVDPAECIFFTASGHFDESSYKTLGERLQGAGRFVVPGFYGSRRDGRIKTFSRGGSDVTGAIVARASGSELYENWTDVSGFLMTDPRIVPEAQRIDEITYMELRELSYMGATVLHDEAIYPLRSTGTPICIKNTHEPDNPGTRILPKRESTRPVCGIAGRGGFTMINIEKALMNQERAFGLRVLSALEEHGVGWEHMPTGIDTISLIVRTEDLEGTLDDILESIQDRCRPDSLSITEDLAMIATVGQGMVHHVGVAARLCDALAGAKVNLKVIDQGSSEMNIIVGVAEEDLQSAVKAIYYAFANWDC